jgi:NADPH:quinone reductase-like Zn-dependent oxidoreductase
MDVPAPAPGHHDILVVVRAAGLNPVDFKFRQGKLRDIFSCTRAAVTSPSLPNSSSREN